MATHSGPLFLLPRFILTLNLVHVNVSGQGRIIDLNVDQTHVLKRLHKCDQIIKFLSYTKILFFLRSNKGQGHNINDESRYYLYME